MKGFTFSQICIATAILGAIFLTGCVTIPVTVGDTAGGTVSITTEILKSNSVPVLSPK